MLQFLLPSFVALFLGTYLTLKGEDEKWDNPEGTTSINLRGKGFKELPEKLKDFKDLERLVLANCKIETLDKDVLMAMPKLHTLDLSNNPIKEIPVWFAELKLKTLDVDETKIDSIPEVVKQAIADISYKDTPLEEKELLAQKEQEKKDEKEGKPKGESFGQFAMRKLIGKEYGFKKEFKKGELYYTKVVPEDKVEKLGQYLEKQGFFNDEKEVSMQITYNDNKDVEAYELRAVYSGGDKLEKSIEEVFKFHATLISSSIFDNHPVHFHLTNDKFVTLHTMKSIMADEK